MRRHTRARGASVPMPPRTTVLLAAVLVVAAAGNGDFDGPIVVTVRMLDVDPGATFVCGIEVKARELGSGRAVRGPARQPLAAVVQVAVLVHILREPDIVVHAAGAILDDVDVPVVV